MPRLYAPRPLNADARRIQLRRVASFEVARLRERAAKKARTPEPAAPTPVDDEPATQAIPYVTMSDLVHGTRNERSAA
jgi:hypothetical protein